MKNRAERRVQRKRIEKIRFLRFCEINWMDEERNWRNFVLKKETKEPPQGVYSKWTGRNDSVSNKIIKKQRNKRERQFQIKMNSRGFTLLELLIVVVILGLLIMVVGGILFVVL